MPAVPISSEHLDASEIAWFAPLCSDDYRYLGVPDGDYRSSWENTSRVVRRADELGFRNILCPSSYQVGQDTLSFVAAASQISGAINLLAAVRCGEMQPIMLARALATLDHMTRGRLTVNIISSDFPGQKEDSAYRYQRSREVVEILKQAWSRERIDFEGEIYAFEGLSTDPVRPYQQNGGPLLYFGGYSPPALELCGEHCDVYLMWPETKAVLAERMRAANAVAAEKHGRVLDYGLRVHVIVREDEQEAREYARSLVSRLDDERGSAIRERALDAELARRRPSGAEPRRAPTPTASSRTTCGPGLDELGRVAARRSSAPRQQIIAEIEEYRAMGIRAFIFSGYPHLEECERFGTLVLPRLSTCSLPEAYGRVPASMPATPLGTGERR